MSANSLSVLIPSLLPAYKPDMLPASLPRISRISMLAIAIDTPRPPQLSTFPEKSTLEINVPISEHPRAAMFLTINPVTECA